MVTVDEAGSRIDQTVQLDDGRTLGFAEYGDPEGDPLLFFPGTPGSRYFTVPDESALEYGVRVLVVDRPGYGLSTLDTDLDLLDWPNDVGELMDSLDIETAAIAGHSGGGAFVLACATDTVGCTPTKDFGTPGCRRSSRSYSRQYEIPERLTGVGLVSSVAPFRIPEINQQMSAEEQHIGDLVETAPGELREFAESIFGDAHEKPEVAYVGILAGTPSPDRAVLEREEIREMMIANISEAFRQGPAVWAHESELFFHPWGIDLTEISMHVDLWQGEQDREVPPFMGRYLVDVLPNCTARFSPDDRHTIFATCWEDIITTLVP